MRIDTHTHFGRYGDWDCPLPKLVELLDAHGIGMAVTGCLESNGTGAAGFEKALEMIRGYEDRLRLMLWVNPAVPGDPEAAARMLDCYRDRIACMKVHPQTAEVPLGDPRYERYLRLCETCGLTLAVHTEPGCYSSADLLADMAEAHPKVNFVAVHMELRGNHRHVMDLIAKYPNLYGDTTFVPAAEVREAVDLCGAEKIVFGSDAPILGERYGNTLAELEALLSPEEKQQIFTRNAVRLFHLGTCDL